MHIIIYHSDLDGRMAAKIVVEHLVATKQVTISDGRFQGVTFIEATYDRRLEILRQLMGRNADPLWIVDFSFTKEQTEALAEGFDLRWYDHHEVVKESWVKDLEIGVLGIRNTRACGTLLVWEDLGQGPLPMCVELTDQWDRWITKGEGAPLYFKLATDVFDSVSDPDSQWYNLQMHSLHDQGEAISQYVAKDVARRRRVLKGTEPNSQGPRFHGLGIVNDSYPHQECASWYQQGDGMIKVSLRSENVDVAAIAVTYGGGGHKNAAGFHMSLGSWVKVLAPC
jgi:oligoribonuclease NrnB/cAMP/cGMP phosphodiesterase (DHH superfamily)